MPLPINQLPIGDGRDANGNRGTTFFVDRGELDIIQRDGPEWKVEEARFLPEAISEPDAIFEGLRRPGEEKSLCYSVRPSYDPDDGISDGGPPRYGVVFVAFARPAVGGLLVFDWEWRQEDSDAPGHPEGWQTDFERRTWQRV